MGPNSAFVQLPGRLFIDSSVLQRLERYGEFIYDGGWIEEDDRIWSVPDGTDNLEALRKIMFVGQRAMFELVLSTNSFREVEDSGDSSYLNWAREVLWYWREIQREYAIRGTAAFTGQGEVLAQKLDSPKFGYLSKKDRLLIRDAVIHECDAFLTMDRKLERNARHIEVELPLKVLSPIAYWELLEPWAALFA